MIENPLNKSDFIKWLQSKKSTDKVGYVGNCIACPIVSFLEEKHGIETLVSSNHFRILGTCEDVRLPSWAKEFIKKVDKSKFNKITAGKCLRILLERK